MFYIKKSPPRPPASKKPSRSWGRGRLRFPLKFRDTSDTLNGAPERHIVPVSQSRRVSRRWLADGRERPVQLSASGVRSGSEWSLWNGFQLSLGVAVWSLPAVRVCELLRPIFLMVSAILHVCISGSWLLSARLTCLSVRDFGHGWLCSCILLGYSFLLVCLIYGCWYTESVALYDSGVLWFWGVSWEPLWISIDFSGCLRLSAVPPPPPPRFSFWEDEGRLPLALHRIFTLYFRLMLLLFL